MESVWSWRGVYERYLRYLALSDTSVKAREVYFERLKAMTPSERINLGVALWNAADSVQRAAILRLCPEADEGEITFRLAVSRFGPELARKAYRRT